MTDDEAKDFLRRLIDAADPPEFKELPNEQVAAFVAAIPSELRQEFKQASWHLEKGVVMLRQIQTKWNV